LTDAAAWIGESISTEAICSMAVLRKETALSEDPEEKGGGTGSGYVPLSNLLHLLDAIQLSKHMSGASAPLLFLLVFILK